MSEDELLERYIILLRRYVTKQRRPAQDREGWWDGFTNAIDKIERELPTILALADDDACKKDK